MPDSYTVDMLEKTSRTFFLPIMNLNGELRDAVMCYYLLTRSVDEIEDHPTMPYPIKARLLRRVGQLLQTRFTAREFADLFAPHQDELPQVTLDIHRWAAEVVPFDVAARLCEAVSAMADRMAYWVEREFRIDSEADLDQYSFCVASSVGIGLCDLWAHYDGVIASHTLAVGFGRTLQSVNMLWNRPRDLARGVDFFPEGWGQPEMRAYADRNLATAFAYLNALPEGQIRRFCALTLDLCRATLQAIDNGTGLDRAKITAIGQRHS
ncbi:squalene/phytoene synthase family protein [Streptomyces sp. NPDC059003]|uniref:squalene/phytoene synthase family protein n=1 Tax=Streptomyces sp. NPDC059003 TaxID=3346691 RepID=UPI003677E249